MACNHPPRPPRFLNGGMKPEEGPGGPRRFQEGVGNLFRAPQTPPGLSDGEGRPQDAPGRGREEEAARRGQASSAGFADSPDAGGQVPITWALVPL